MNAAAIILIGIIGLLMIYTALRLFSGVVGNYKYGRELRQGLLDRMNMLPISKLLSRYDIDAYEYVNRQSINEIENQIRRCEGCDHTDGCAKDLNTSRVDIHQILKACPNSQGFENYKNTN